MKSSQEMKSDLEDYWEFYLYVAGHTPETISTLANLKKICEKHFPSHYKINIIDLLKKPHLAKEMQIFAIPTTIKKTPSPPLRLIGDFSNANDIVTKFGITEND